MDEMLKYAVENGIVDLSYIREMYEMNKREEILKEHPYKIWEGKDGKWYTYLPDEKKKRALKKRNTEKAIKSLIVAYYEELESRPCFREEYFRWIAEKEKYCEIGKNSITRYDNDFHRFFPENEPFCKIRLCDVTDSDLEHFIKGTIRKNALSAKSYAMLRLILSGVFKYAKREGHTDFSISRFFMDFALPKNIFKRKIKENSDEVFNLDEARMLMEYFKREGTPECVALHLQFLSGVRVGELAALKWEDYKGDVLKIHRTEITYRDKKSGSIVVEVKEYPKTEAGVREVIIPPEARNILDGLKESARAEPGDYMFVKNRKRIGERAYDYWIRKACREVGIKERSTHKIRKTYVSKLLSENVDDAIVAEQVGHKQITTTHTYYHFDVTTNPERVKEICCAATF